nr:arylsulfatase [Robertkochia solimangrovi]
MSCNTSPDPGSFEKKRPNIIIVMADDLGFSDLGSYGGEIHTPNLDYLAANGVRMNSFYNTSRCCPSRAALLTGRYPHQAGIGQMTMDQHQPGYRGTLATNAVTLAEVLKNAGYNTGMVGKWHVSETEDLGGEDQLKWLAHQEDHLWFSDPDTYPVARGFDRFYGNIWGVVDYFDPFALVSQEKPVKSVPDDFYYTDAIGDTTVTYIKELAKQDEPFFLYVAHCAPHWPLQAPEEVIRKYENTYKAGWKAIRKARYERLINSGIFQGDTAALSEFMFSDVEWEENNDTIWDSRAMAVHAAMVDVLDQNIGKLISGLEETGTLENTVIMFLSDNGASSERPSVYGPGFDRPGQTRKGETIHYPVQKDIEQLPGSETVYSGIGPQWANVLNTPFRYWKARVFEGGITTPFIMHWPEGLKEKGSVNSATAHIIDIMPTVMELAGAAYPKTYKGQDIAPFMGTSIMPTITGEMPTDTERVLFWEHFGAAALRKGDWKLVRLDHSSPWELYDLRVDRTEMHNVAENYPERLEELQGLWQKMADSTQVFPKP